MVDEIKHSSKIFLCRVTCSVMFSLIDRALAVLSTCFSALLRLSPVQINLTHVSTARAVLCGLFRKFERKTFGRFLELVPRGITAGRVFAVRSWKQSTKEGRAVAEQSEEKSLHAAALRTHMSVHSDDHPFRCHHCGKTFAMKDRLRLHVRVHTGEKPYNCNRCGKSFARGGQLQQHLRSHTGERPYSCSRCPATFACATNLKVHMKRHLGEKDHECTLCGKLFTRRDGLRKHLLCFHRGEKPFVCGVCGKRYKGHITQHARTHSEERPHVCPDCGAAFVQRSQLTVHRRIHTGEKPYECRVCKRAFAHSTALKLHVRRHTGEKPFKCLICGASFAQLPHLKKHMRCIHKSDKPYLCPAGCGRFFKTKNDLEAHQEKDKCVKAEETTPDQAATNCKGEPGEEADNALSTMDVNSLVESVMDNKFRVVPKMTVEQMRLHVAVLLKRISTPSRLEALGFGRRLIDEVLRDSIEGSGRKAAGNAKSSSKDSEGNDSDEDADEEGLEVSEKSGESKGGAADSAKEDEAEVLRRNVEILLEWTVPQRYMQKFRKENRSIEDLLEELAS
ncbi:zinc finger protein 345-like isoform X2 [Ischnura elegans]|uniref:zinc finger protein 345-like isoform X2 n=1 Tax=Ischnura elegans TaxID=197161 RepID=UPI001ED8692F|nr:zinc finger protein 345-like isoform X2 [Ischnura elegans]